MIPLRSEFQDLNRQQIEAHLIARAGVDPDFRRRLLTEPRAALAAEIGLDVPPDFHLEVLEERPDLLCLVLPPPEGELSDLELEGVAGGKGQDQRSLPSHAEITQRPGQPPLE